MDKIGEKIKAIRKSKGITQKQLSEMTGITQAYISMLENKINEPGIISIMKIAKAFDCSVDELIGMEGKSA